jgi:hypothetical protein
LRRLFEIFRAADSVPDEVLYCTPWPYSSRVHVSICTNPNYEGRQVRWPIRQRLKRSNRSSSTWALAAEQLSEIGPEAPVMTSLLRSHIRKCRGRQGSSGAESLNLGGNYHRAKQCVCKMPRLNKFSENCNCTKFNRRPYRGKLWVSYNDTCTVELAKLLHDPS